MHQGDFFDFKHSTLLRLLEKIVCPGVSFVIAAKFYFFLIYLFIYLYSRFLLVTYFIHISVYMSIPISQFIPPLLAPLSPFGFHTFVLYICVAISALQTSSSVPFF